jgi:hypothetical protein
MKSELQRDERKDLRPVDRRASRPSSLEMARAELKAVLHEEPASWRRYTTHRLKHFASGR